MKTAKKSTATARKNAAKVVNVHVPAGVDNAWNKTAEKVNALSAKTRQVALEVEKKVTSVAKDARKTTEAIAKDPKGFIDNVVRDGKTLSQKVGQDVTKAGTKAVKIAGEVGNKVADAVENVVEKGLHRLNVPTRHELRTLSAKVDGLGRKIDALTATRSRRRRAA
jgi:polyhydroxyalkanoate synthesis regulator phasin